MHLGIPLRLGHSQNDIGETHGLKRFSPKSLKGGLPHLSKGILD